MIATGALFATLCAAYGVSQFLRSSVGVIAPNLAAELSLSPVEVGLLSSVFFFTFAATQLPLGVAMDRFGPKACIVTCIALLLLGSLLFAAAWSGGMLILGRMLLGFGSASLLMGPLTIYARWFPPERFSTITGAQIALGSLGTVAATAPFAWAVSSVGWRLAFVGVAVIAAGVGLMVLLLVSDDPPGKVSEPRRETLRQSIAGILEAMRMPSVGPLFLMQLTSYPSFLLLISLWGGPYLTHVYGYDLKGRGDILFIPAIMQIIGAFCWGPMDRVFGRCKPPVLLGTALTILPLAVLAAFPKLPTPLLIADFVLLGLATALSPVLIAHGKSLFPPHLIGRGLTLLNIGTIGGAFLSQTISGAVIQLFTTGEGGAYPAVAYQVVFGLQAAMLLIAAIAYSRVREERRR